MSIKIQSIYEKMLKNPDFKKRLIIEQPTPENPSGRIKDEYGNVLNERESDAMKELDRRMMERQKRQQSSDELNEIEKLKKRVKTLEEALIMVMDSHKKLMKKGG
jgi:hypothetical protein